ncbi:uncharacterized protein LOC110981981 [Acanthaster planci]|uniref:Uncharacterized protein LOC110981981 n=1 Tax=Acanthaster planci TaxID=133434 RepID=A0A8B7YWT5_ACAPL|nr:uncharacterized protein LOC110981981 [Acanthaster planci]
MNTNYPPPAYVAQPSGQQQLVMTQPAPSVVVNQSREGSWKTITSTGITQVVLGSLTIIFGIVNQTALKNYYRNDIGSPIWCGLLFYVVAGILGIVSGKKRSRGVAIAYMVMSILASLSAICVIGFSAAGLTFVNGYYCRYHYFYTDVCDLKKAFIGVYATLILLAVVEFVISIIGASMTCSPLCATTPVTHTVIQYQVPQQMMVAGQPQGTVVYNTGQPIGAYQVQQGQYPQAPPTDQHQYQELAK